MQQDSKIHQNEKKIQKVVGDVFATVLGLEKIGLNENFFKLGGHSLTATKAAYHIHSRLGVEVSVTALFENPTVAELSGLIENDLRKKDSRTSTDSIPRIKRSGPLPTSYAQKRMWFLSRIEPESPLYNVSFMLYLNGHLNIQALKESINSIIRRHDSLRTTFDTRGDELVQIVHPPTYQRIPVEKIAGHSTDGPDKLVSNKVIKEEARTRFDLQKGPLARFRIFHLSKDAHVLLFTVHHIVIDGWSVEVLLGELVEAYTARVKGREPHLPSIPIQYADYADWQKQWVKTQAYKKQLAYWLDRLKGPLPILELPSDYERPPVLTYQGRRISLIIKSELTNRLNQLSNRQGATLFMTLLAAFNVLLYRSTAQEDLIVGSPIANRTRREIEPMIGLFLNTVALRTDLSGNPTFRSLLERIQRVCLDAYINQDLPFEQLVAHLQPERMASRFPVFQVMFVLQNAHHREIALPDLEVVCEEVSTDTSKVDLTLFIEELGGELVATAEYNTDLFKAGTIKELLGYYQGLLEKIVSDPDTPLRDPALLKESEQNRAADRISQPTRTYPRNKCVHRLFEEQAATTPDAVAVVFKEQQLTYRTLNEQANRLAWHLRKKGVEPDTLVGIYLDRCTELIIAILAILKAGGAYVPLDPSYPEGRLRQMIETSDCRIILTQDQMISHLQIHGAQIICLDSDWAAISGESAESLPSITQPDHLAYVMFTSGSTGRPKAVGIPHRGIVSLLFDIDYVDLAGHQTFLQLAPVSFDASTFEIWGALLHGHRCILFPHRIPDLTILSHILEIYHVSCLWLTSSLFNFVIDEKPEALKGVSQLLTGGEALSGDHVRRALELLPHTQLINGYGPTETTTFACCYPIPRHLDERLRSVPIGRAIAHRHVHILDEQLNPVPVGMPGELHIGGDALARGYLNSPELTRERFIANPFDPRGGGRLYKTGDLCRYLPDGNIEFLGRLDDQVKIRGFRIEPGEIESALGRHPAVKQVAVVAREDRLGERQLVGYIVRAHSGKAAAEDLRSFLKDRLPEYMIPSVFVYLDSMPLMPNGKINRNALPAPEGEQMELQPGYSPPVTPVEKALASIFAEVLHLEKVGIHDDFFKLGGHSLLAVTLLDRIQSRFNRSFPVSVLLQARTVKQLSELISTGGTDIPQSPVVLLREGGPAMPLFMLPGRGGHAIGFFHLANRLPPDRAIYGLEFKGLDGKAEPLRSIPEMAAYFIDLIQRIQKQGPYYLVGFSLGGTIAFEMALQLTKQGQDIGMLAMIASPAPGHIRTSKYRLVRYALRSMDFLALSFKEKLAYLSFKLRIDLKRRIRLWRQEYTLRASEGDAGRLLRKNIRKVENSAYEAWFRYKSNTLYSGNILLIREADIDTPLYRPKIHGLTGWERWVTGAIESHEIPSAHADILDEAYTGLIAEKITNYMRGKAETGLSQLSDPMVSHVQDQDYRKQLLSWPTALDITPIPQNEVHVFLADLDGYDSVAKHSSLLSPDELDRADSYAKDLDRARFITRRGLLRKLLGRYIHIEPANIKIKYTEDGRPFLGEEQNTSDLHFSLAARNGLALYAFTCNRSVGIDLEYMSQDENLLAIAKQQFSHREYKDVSNLPESEQSKAFYSYWTSKEAYIKARGIIQLAQFDVSIRPGQNPQLMADRNDPSQVGKWSFSLLNIGSHWRAVVVVKGKNLPLQRWKIM